MSYHYTDNKDIETHPGLRIMDGKFAAVQQAVGCNKPATEGARYIAAFVEKIHEGSGRAQVGMRREHDGRDIEQHAFQGVTEFIEAPGRGRRAEFDRAGDASDHRAVRRDLE